MHKRIYSIIYDDCLLIFNIKFGREITNEYIDKICYGSGHEMTGTLVSCVSVLESHDNRGAQKLYNSSPILCYEALL